MMMVTSIDQCMRTEELLMDIHRIIVIRLIVVKNDFCVQTVVKIYLVHDIYLEMNVLIVSDVMKIVFRIDVKNVEEKSVLIPR